MTKQNTQRKTVDEQVSVESIHDILDGRPPGEVIKIMQMYIEQYYDKSLYFKVISYGYDGAVEIQLWEQRLENDKEYNARLKREEKLAFKNAKEKEERRSKEYAEYLRLKAKFEGEV